jgi:hypothetical protein
MPLKVHAGQVKEKYNEQALDRVERLVAGEIGEVKQLLTQVLRATEKAVDAHFATQDAEGKSPYPQYDGRQYVATVNVDFGMTEAQNKVIGQRGSPVYEKIAATAQQLITEAGFALGMSWIQSGNQITGAQFKIWDPEFRPIDENQQANALFEQRVKEQRP